MSPGQAARRRLGSSAGLAPFPHRFHSTKQRCRVSRGKAACRAVIPRFPDTSAVDQGPAARSYPLQPVPPPRQGRSPGGTTAPAAAAARRGRSCAGAGIPYARALRHLRRLTGARASRRRPEAPSNAEARARRLCPVRSRGLAPERRERTGRAGRGRAGGAAEALPAPSELSGPPRSRCRAPGGRGGEPVLVRGADVPRLPSVASPECGRRLGAEGRRVAWSGTGTS